MPENEGPYKQIRPEDMVTDEKMKEALSALEQPWQPEKARFTMASVLAIGLLVLFGLTVACSSTVIVSLVITSALPSASNANPGEAIDQMLQFVTTLIPYIATPLGIALGFFFRDIHLE